MIPADPTKADQQYCLYFTVNAPPLAVETYFLTVTDSPPDLPLMEIFQFNRKYI